MTDITITVQTACAYWYACGYNDHRQPETDRFQPYVDPHAFAVHWVEACEQPSHPSLQDVFKAWVVTL